jgi:hypothetical protein
MRTTVLKREKPGDPYLELQLDGTWIPIPQDEVDRRVESGAPVSWNPTDETRALDQLRKEAV